MILLSWLYDEMKNKSMHEERYWIDSHHAFWLNSLRYNNANLSLHDNCNSHLILIISSSPYWLIQNFNWFIDIGTRFCFLLYPLVSIWLIDTIIKFHIYIHTIRKVLLPLHKFTKVMLVWPNTPHRSFLNQRQCI